MEDFGVKNTLIHQNTENAICVIYIWEDNNIPNNLATLGIRRTY